MLKSDLPQAGNETDHFKTFCIDLKIMVLVYLWVILNSFCALETNLLSMPNEEYCSSQGLSLENVWSPGL